MLVMGVVDVETFSEGEAERAGFDECKVRQATRGFDALNGCLYMGAM